MKNWRALLTKPVEDGRQLLREVLAGPLRFTPQGKRVAAYLEASSPRRQQIEAYLEQQDRHGAGPPQIAAHQTREAKQDLSPEEILRQHREMARAFGDRPAHVVQAAHARAHDLAPHVARITAHAAVTFA